MNLLDDTPPTVKRKELGLAGAVLLISQLVGSYQASQNVSAELVNFRADLQKNTIEREQYFVRKTDVIPVIDKLDKLSDKLAAIDLKLTSLKAFVRPKAGYLDASFFQHKPYRLKFKAGS